MDDEELGTVRWFGTPWGAPVCDPRTQVAEPVGEPCAECLIPIRVLDQGVTIPHLGDTIRSAWHLDCFLKNVGMRPTASTS